MLNPSILVSLMALLMALACASALAQGKAGLLRAAQVQPCVAAHALPGDAFRLFEALPAPEALAELQLEARQRGVSDQELALMTARDDKTAEWDETQAKHKAAQAFAQCVQRIKPQLAADQIQRCEEDLYALPVILLYRADGLSQLAAAADIVRGGAPGEDTRMQARMPKMLQFAYQGPGPVPGKARSWIDQQVPVWTARCLMEDEAAALP